MTLDFNPSEQTFAFGYHFVLGLSGSRLAREDKELLRRVRPVGILVEDRNFIVRGSVSERQEAYRVLVTEAKKYTERENVFLCFGTATNRSLHTMLPCTDFGPPDRFGSYAKDVGAAIALESCAYGAAVLFAPQLVSSVHGEELTSEAQEFGRDYETVARLGVEYFRGISLPDASGRNATACPGDFPGRSSVVIHSSSPLKRNEVLDEMKCGELLPFTAVIADGAGLMRVASTASRIDPEVPAMLSPHVVRGLLRDELGYSGVIVSSDISSPHICGLFRNGTGVRNSIAAGCDLLVCGRSDDPYGGYPLRFTGHVVQALRERLLTEEALYDSCHRISAMLDSLAVIEPTIAPPNEILQRNARLAEELR